MIIHRYMHACVVLEDDNQKLVIDPGNVTSDFGSLENITAVVITHEHPDHFYLDNVLKIIDANPNVRIYSTAAVADSVEYDVTVVNSGNKHTAGPFDLYFTGTLHAQVHPDWPQTVENRGVRVNQDFYYAGDSFALPDKSVKVLAVPLSFAWAPMEKIMDYITQVQPESCITIHDNPLSYDGRATANRWVSKMCEREHINLIPLAPSQSLEL